MFAFWPPRRPQPPVPLVVVEDPDMLGYAFVPDPLLDVMDAADWRALERSALDRAA